MFDNLKILVTSDTHGNLPKITTPFDLLLICGDISPTHDHYYAYQINWFQHQFAEWINTLPFKDEWSKVVIIGGNHDFMMERINNEELKCFYITTNNRVVVLKNEEYDYEYLSDEGIKTLKIFGTPYCKIFGSWAFMISNEKLATKYSFIPENCDILMSHDAPDINNLGLISSGAYSGENAGNIVLAEAIKEKKPKFAFCGHIHSGNHMFTKENDTWLANVSYVNERYSPYYPEEQGIFVLNLDRKTKEPVFDK